ncbi:MBL fold metallo-hydrolase [Streptomyces sp. H39-S7]|uniref:MBL fold metallo-hydrolase n=1 Tax=Streptomyces sp. H39-S7 TaxID=3004357 RepID=UPI0022AF6DE9|nr:MBL fold metallo-hydrolase [Streptomyces sp. H39-S7]MCZ4118401.1 MBL fold metallo-hydrolase [Streptomyces sp. H39-S7]
MLIAGFPAGAWGTNCYVVAPAAGEECVIIDPGHQATQGVEDTLAKHRLKPVAVILTHGHIDHVASVVPVCGAHDVPAWIHPRDRYMMSDPEKALGRSIGQQLLGELTIGEPDDVRELTDGAALGLAGLEFTVSHAPGHTKGSVTFRLPESSDVPSVFFSGDLLFAGSVGRSDLPGGSADELMESLARVCLPLDDSTVVLSGHGPQTTIGRERAANPYLGEAARGFGAGSPAPRRGL